MNISRLPIGFFLVLVTMCATPALAVVPEDWPDFRGAPEIGFTVGYDNISLGSNSTIHDEDALRFAFGGSFSPIRPVPQIRLGADIGASLVIDNSTHFISSGSNGLIIAGSASVPLWILEPEATASWRQTFGARNQFFIEPGIAGGGAFGYLDLHDVNNPDRYYHADSDTGYGRVFLRAGGLVYTGTFGVEASYLRGGNMNFGGNASGDLEEFYIGLYGAFHF